MAEKIKEEIGDLTIVYEVSLITAIKKFSAKRYGEKGLAIANEEVTSVFMKSAGIKNVEAIYRLETVDFGIAFSKKNIEPAFVEKFNSTIISMKKSGELKKILEPYELQAAN